MTSAQPAPARAFLAVILAAGEGSRMKSATPKVLHAVAGRSMLAHVIAATEAAGAARVAVVVGPDREDVATAARAASAAVETFVQSDRRGTAHATLAARAALEGARSPVLVAFADTPLVAPETLARLALGIEEGAAVAVLGFEAKDPTGYGRLVRDAGGLAAIREHKDASEAERAITLCNAGLMAIAGDAALPLLESIGCDNAQGEFYLPDVVAAARAKGLHVETVIAGEAEVMGVNDRAQLSLAEAAMQRRLRARAMAEGATLVAPETVFFSHDTALDRDVVVEPHVVFGPGVRVGEGATIHAFSHLTQAVVEAKASIGPYARLRPGAEIGAGAKIGNFVEIKASAIGAGAAVGHLSYIGDASVGAKANIGAGTITCNYDGFDKFRTEIGAGAFIGSNTCLVAPVRVGDGAFTATGSIVTENVEADALAIARSRQVVKPGWAEAFRAMKAKLPRRR